MLVIIIIDARCLISGRRHRRLFPPFRLRLLPLHASRHADIVTPFSLRCATLL